MRARCEGPFSLNQSGRIPPKYGIRDAPSRPRLRRAGKRCIPLCSAWDNALQGPGGGIGDAAAEVVSGHSKPDSLSILRIRRTRVLQASGVTVTVTSPVNKWRTPSYPSVNTDPTDGSWSTTSSGEIGPRSAFSTPFRRKRPRHVGGSSIRLNCGSDRSPT